MPLLTMVSRYYKPIRIIAFLIAFSGIGYTQQQPTNLSPSTIQQIQQRMRENGIRQPDSLLISKALTEQQKTNKSRSAGPDSLKMQADTTKDSIQKQAQSLSEFEKPDTSIYERLIRGEVLQPDSILKNIETFGHSVFSQNKALSLSPENQVSVPADYLVGPGDELVIVLWGRINEENHLTVSRDGSINLPRVGPITVAGMPFNVMQKTIADRLQAMEGVQVSVNMGQLRSISVFLVGDVVRPGQYTLSALSDVTSALFAAGGVTKQGSLRNIQLRRNGRLVATLDFYDFLLSGNNFGNIRLSSGDVLFVPVVQSMAAIAGNVRRSALYELNGKTSLKKFIELAGGFSPAAWMNRIQVDRFNKKQYQMVLDLRTDGSDKLPDFTIEDGDVVRVFQVLERDRNAVYLAGNVMRPGKYELTEGMRVSDVIKSFDDLLPETYLDYAVIHRLVPPQYTESILSFNLQSALKNPGGPDDLLLQPYDNIVTYNRDFFEPDRVVTISGAVTAPGTFRMLDNMHIKDLVLQAGGLTDAASTDRGELYRRTVADDTVQTTKASFCVHCALEDDPQHNLALNKMDKVFIRQKRGWEETRKITLLGEFTFPGEYVLLQGESLGQLIRRAGGFTSQSYLEAAVFMRRSVKDMEKKRNEEYVRTLEADIARLSAEMAAKENAADAQAILNQQVQLLQRLRSIEPVGRVVIDLKKPQTYESFTLEDGDSLFVPKMLNTVSVMGEVFNPATFQRDPDAPQVRNYLSMAGGAKKTADKRNAYVIKASGSVESAKRGKIANYQLEPGDVVIVPQRIRYVSGYRVFMETVDAIYKVAMTAAVVFTLLNR